MRLILLGRGNEMVHSLGSAEGLIKVSYVDTTSAIFEGTSCPPDSKSHWRCHLP